jgi:hypothetical protein
VESATGHFKNLIVSIVTYLCCSEVENLFRDRGLAFDYTMNSDKAWLVKTASEAA